MSPFWLLTKKAVDEMRLGKLCCR